MAGNDGIKILRGDASTIGQSTQTLNEGQPLYNTTQNYLTIGAEGGGSPKDKPVRVRELGGRSKDDNTISPDSGYQDTFYVKHGGSALNIHDNSKVVIDTNANNNGVSIECGDTYVSVNQNAVWMDGKNITLNPTSNGSRIGQTNARVSIYSNGVDLDNTSQLKFGNSFGTNKNPIYIGNDGTLALCDKFNATSGYNKKTIISSCARSEEESRDSTDWVPIKYRGEEGSTNEAWVIADYSITNLWNQHFYRIGFSIDNADDLLSNSWVRLEINKDDVKGVITNVIVTPIVYSRNTTNLYNNIVSCTNGGVTWSSTSGMIYFPIPTKSPGERRRFDASITIFTVESI